MSIYKSGVDAYRETTKWLVAFIPVTAITTTAVLLAAPLRAGALAASDPSTWMARHGSIVWCAIVVIAAIGAILWCAARVLSAAPIEVASILERGGGCEEGDRRSARLRHCRAGFPQHGRVRHSNGEASRPEPVPVPAGTRSPR